MKHLHKCPTTGEYTMKDVCAHGDKAVSPLPQKYSPEDNHGEYRRKAKKEEFEKEGTW